MPAGPPSCPQSRSAGNVVVAFAAGLLSFLSPCVLPLIPSYVGFLTGMTVEEVERRRGTAFLHAVWFVAGFSLVFVLLGAGASAVGNLLRDYQVWLGRAGGVLLILFGLYLLGILRPAFLMRERRASDRFWAAFSPSRRRRRGWGGGWCCWPCTRWGSRCRSC